MHECGCPELPVRWWQDEALHREVAGNHGGLEATNLLEIERVHGSVRPNTLSKWRGIHGFPKLKPGTRPPETLSAPAEDGWLLAALRKLGDEATVDELADHADVSPRRVRGALERLGHAGYRVGAEGARVVLERVPPERLNLHTALFDGDTLRVGVVSDTHVGANEEALDELHLAYDIFAREGIAEVWHAGDWGTGVGMFRTHHAESKVHTAEDQVDYLVDNYPARPGIVTKGISGNHDLEGEFGRIGFDPVAALANRRPDIEYLGAYDAWLELREGTGSWVNLKHGAGGMSYSFSYKAQKLVDGYPSGRKPAALIVGHWHVRGNIRHRDVEVLWPGCFEWQSRFLKRLGLQPAVGFHIVELKVADDGSVVEWTPRWFPFFAGRKVAAA